MAMLQMRAMWIEEDPGGYVRVETMLIEDGLIEELSDERCSWSELASVLCERLHELIGGSTRSSAGASS